MEVVTWDHAELFAVLHAHFRRRHPDWFDLANYRSPTKKEARKLARLREEDGAVDSMVKLAEKTVRGRIWGTRRK